MNTQVTQRSLTNFFEKVAKKDKELLDIIKLEQCFNIDNKSWHFSLPNLHVFLNKLLDDEYKNIDYAQFRKLLFSSPINQTIKPCGAEISIADNQENVDKSKYVLIWN